MTSKEKPIDGGEVAPDESEQLADDDGEQPAKKKTRAAKDREWKCARRSCSAVWKAAHGSLALCGCAEEGGGRRWAMLLTSRVGVRR